MNKINNQLNGELVAHVYNYKSKMYCRKFINVRFAIKNVSKNDFRSYWPSK